MEKEKIIIQEFATFLPHKLCRSPVVLLAGSTFLLKTSID
jgi:hypothetical protein